jgi:hypothetical protein
LREGIANAEGKLPPCDHSKLSTKKPLHVNGKVLKMDVMLLLGVAAHEMATENGTKKVTNLEVECEKACYGAAERGMFVLLKFFEGLEAFKKLFHVIVPTADTIADGLDNGKDGETHLRKAAWPRGGDAGITVGQNETLNCDIDLNFVLFTDHCCTHEVTGKCLKTKKREAVAAVRATLTVQSQWPDWENERKGTLWSGFKVIIFLDNNFLIIFYFFIQIEHTRTPRRETPALFCGRI